MNIAKIQTIFTTCRRFVDNEAELYELADALEEPLVKLQTLLIGNGIIELSGNVNPCITYQDLVNVILYYYASTSYHEFVEIAWVGRTAQSRRGAKRV